MTGEPFTIVQEQRRRRRRQLSDRPPIAVESIRRTIANRETSHAPRDGSAPGWRYVPRGLPAPS